MRRQIDNLAQLLCDSLNSITDLECIVDNDAKKLLLILVFKNIEVEVNNLASKFDDKFYEKIEKTTTKEYIEYIKDYQKTHTVPDFSDFHNCRELVKIN
jgi:hypothetical protein